MTTQEIAAKVAENNKSLHDEVARHEAAVYALEDSLSAIQNKCEHVWNRFSDPAGGQSHFQCAICEKWR